MPEKAVISYCARRRHPDQTNNIVKGFSIRIILPKNGTGLHLGGSLTDPPTQETRDVYLT